MKAHSSCSARKKGKVTHRGVKSVIVAGVKVVICFETCEVWYSAY